MRAIDCEACGRPQPKDWQPGQRCIHCGGAVRTETRCAACTEWTPAGKFCRHCAAELLPDDWYGAARMLVAAGVDALSLASRVRALDPEQRETFSSRFASQRAVVEGLVQEARFAESFLLTKGHADRLEEALVRQLPWPQGAAAERAAAVQRDLSSREDLTRLLVRSTTPETRTLAALGLARGGAPGAQALDELRWRLAPEDPLGVEALVAAARLTVVREADLFSRRTLEGVDRLLARLREQLPDGAERALVEAAVLRLRRRDWAQAPEGEALRSRLREGLSAADLQLRASCALLLGDAVTLDALLDEPALRDRALRALSALGAPQLVARLRASGDDGERKQFLRLLRSPLDGDAFAAVASVVASSSDELQREVVRVLTRTPWAEVDAPSRGALDAWVARAGVPTDSALDLLHWAVSTGDAKRPYRALAEVQPYAVAAARAMAREPRERKTLGDHRLGDLFAVATDGRALELVVDWLQDDATRDEALRRLFHLLGYLASYSDPPDERGVTVLLAAWDRLGDAGRERLAPHFAELFRREVGNPTRDQLLRAFWERFLAQPGERAALWLATRAGRRELEALRDDDPRAAALDGGDPARRFAVYGALDPLGAPELLRALCERHGDGAALAGLTPAVLSLADTLLARGEHRHALWLAASWMSEVVNRFRDEEARETWRATALGLEGAWQQVCATRAATTPKDPNDSLRTFEEQAATELRLAREVVEREVAHRERERQRAEERAAREAERERQLAAQAAERAERERQLAAQAAEREAEAKRRLDAARDAVSAQVATLADGGDASALDTEVLVPGQPISTLRDYVALMRAMREGADILSLFAQYGLTPVTWGACAGAWSTLMTRRIDVAMRFAKLLS